MVRRTRPGISRFSDVQLHIVAHRFAMPRNDERNRHCEDPLARNDEGSRLICPSCQSAATDGIELAPKSAIHPPLSRLTGGAARDRHGRGTGCGGRRQRAKTKRACGGRRSRVVLTPRRWRQVGDDAREAVGMHGVLFEIEVGVPANILVMPGLAAFATKLRRPDTESPAKPRRRRDPGIHHLRIKFFRRGWMTWSSPLFFRSLPPCGGGSALPSPQHLLSILGPKRIRSARSAPRRLPSSPPSPSSRSGAPVRSNRWRGGSAG